MHGLHSFVLGSFLACRFILLVRSQHSKGDPWKKCRSTKIILMKIQQLVPKGARRKASTEEGEVGNSRGWGLGEEVDG